MVISKKGYPKDGSSNLPQATVSLGSLSWENSWILAIINTSII
jgi:hypothetical protein